MRIWCTAIVAALGAIVAPAIASAQTAVATADVNMRAGPSPEFPVVTTIPEDARVAVHGCLQGYSWCDVSWDDERGWASSGYLSFLYRDRYVSITDYGPENDLPIISYNVGTYWDEYYRDRPWYGSRSRWVAFYQDDDRRRIRTREFRDRDGDRHRVDRRAIREDRTRERRYRDADAGDRRVRVREANREDGRRVDRRNDETRSRADRTERRMEARSQDRRRGDGNRDMRSRDGRRGGDAAIGAGGGSSGAPRGERSRDR